MRRFLSLVGVALTAGAFIMLCLCWLLKINILIPILMFAAALVILGIVKRMPADESEASAKDDNVSSGNEENGGEN